MKKGNSRAEPSTAKAKGKMNKKINFWSNTSFVTYFPLLTLFEYVNTRLLDFLEFSDFNFI